MFTPHNMSHVTCHMSHVMCHMSFVTCHLSHVTCHMSIFKASALYADAFYESKYPSVCLSVCPSMCVFTFEVLFKRLFAPTSRSRISNMFRDLESLGKSNGKKWSQIRPFLFGSALKSPRKKN